MVWVNQVLPGTIAISVHDLKALTLADRQAFFEAVEELAEAKKSQQASAQGWKE